RELFFDGKRRVRRRRRVDSRPAIALSGHLRRLLHLCRRLCSHHGASPPDQHHVAGIHRRTRSGSRLRGDSERVFQIRPQRSRLESAGGRDVRQAATRGLVDGLKLASLILGTILTVGLAAVLLSAYTPTFDILGRPLIPIIKLLGIPSPEVVAPATIVGITEMYVPVVLAQGAADRKSVV